MSVKRANWMVLILAVVLGLYSSAFAVGEISIEEIVSLYEKGVTEQTIIALIDSRDATFNLTTQDILYLKDVKIPDSLVNYMLSRKPGDTTTGNGGGTTEGGSTPIKVGTVNILLEGEYSETSSSDSLNFLCGIAVDDDIKTHVSGFDEVAILGNTYKYYTYFGKQASIALTPGDYEVQIKLWTGEGIPDLKSMPTVYSETITIDKGQILDIKYYLENDKSDPSKVVITKQ